jgi:hypothetical protein
MYILVINFQSLGMWFLKGPKQLGIQICSDFHLFYSNENLSPYTWHAMDKHGIYIYIFIYLFLIF